MKLSGKILIRPARPRDIDQLVELCARHAAYEKAKFSPEGKAERLRSALFRKNPRLWCLVAADRKSIVGYATWTRDFSTWRAADYLHMDCLFIDSRYRNQGLGAEMMNAIARTADAMGFATIEWQTPAWNEKAARFYQGRGAQASEKLRFSWTPLHSGG
jgi:GNAT superfamily N-acetyltransferase